MFLGCEVGFLCCCMYMSVFVLFHTQNDWDIFRDEQDPTVGKLHFRISKGGAGKVSTGLGAGRPSKPKKGEVFTPGSDIYPAALILFGLVPLLFCWWGQNWAALLGMRERRRERRLEKQLVPSCSK